MLFLADFHIHQSVPTSSTPPLSASIHTVILYLNLLFLTPFNALTCSPKEMSVHRFTNAVCTQPHSFD